MEHVVKRVRALGEGGGGEAGEAGELEGKFIYSLERHTDRVTN